MPKGAGEQWVCLVVASTEGGAALSPDGLERNDILAVRADDTRRMVEVQVKTASRMPQPNWPLRNQDVKSADTPRSCKQTTATVPAGVAMISGEAFAALVPVMAPGKLNAMIGSLEQALVNASTDQALEHVRNAGMSISLLRAALTVRRDVGRLNDLIHALAIGLTLETLLEPDECITVAPSLAAGNDAATQTFDLQTDRRAAEFKLSIWTGHDSQRMRGLFGDLVNLAVHTPDGLTPQLLVVGHRPGKWLAGTRSRLAWALDGAKRSTVAAVEELGAPADMPIPQFVATYASAVEVIDLGSRIAGLEQMLAGTTS